MPKIFLIKNRLHQQQQRLLESQNLLQNKNEDDRLVPPLPSPNDNNSTSSSPPTSRQHFNVSSLHKPLRTPSPTQPPRTPEPHDSQSTNLYISRSRSISPPVTNSNTNENSNENPLNIISENSSINTSPFTSSSSFLTRKRFHHRRHYFGQQHLLHQQQQEKLLQEQQNTESPLSSVPPIENQEKSEPINNSKEEEKNVDIKDRLSAETVNRNIEKPSPPLSPNIIHSPTITTQFPVTTTSSPANQGETKTKDCSSEDSREDLVSTTNITNNSNKLPNVLSPKSEECLSITKPHIILTTHGGKKPFVGGVVLTQAQRKVYPSDILKKNLGSISHLRSDHSDSDSEDGSKLIVDEKPFLPEDKPLSLKLRSTPPPPDKRPTPPPAPEPAVRCSVIQRAPITASSNKPEPKDHEVLLPATGFEHLGPEQQEPIDYHIPKRRNSNIDSDEEQREALNARRLERERKLREARRRSAILAARAVIAQAHRLNPRFVRSLPGILAAAAGHGRTSSTGAGQGFQGSAGGFGNSNSGNSSSQNPGGVGSAGSPTGFGGALGGSGAGGGMGGGRDGRSNYGPNSPPSGALPPFYESLKGNTSSTANFNNANFLLQNAAAYLMSAANGNSNTGHQGGALNYDGSGGGGGGNGGGSQISHNLEDPANIITSFAAGQGNNNFNLNKFSSNNNNSSSANHPYGPNPSAYGIILKDEPEFDYDEAKIDINTFTQNIIQATMGNPGNFNASAYEDAIMNDLANSQGPNGAIDPLQFTATLMLSSQTDHLLEQLSDAVDLSSFLQRTCVDEENSTSPRQDFEIVSTPSLTPDSVSITPVENNSTNNNLDVFHENIMAHITNNINRQQNSNNTNNMQQSFGSFERHLHQQQQQPNHHNHQHQQQSMNNNSQHMPNQHQQQHPPPSYQHATRDLMHLHQQQHQFQPQQSQMMPHSMLQLQQNQHQHNLYQQQHSQQLQNQQHTHYNTQNHHQQHHQQQTQHNGNGSHHMQQQQQQHHHHHQHHHHAVLHHSENSNLSLPSPNGHHLTGVSSHHHHMSSAASNASTGSNSGNSLLDQAAAAAMLDTKPLIQSVSPNHSSASSNTSSSSYGMLRKFSSTSCSDSSGSSLRSFATAAAATAVGILPHTPTVSMLHESKVLQQRLGLPPESKLEFVNGGHGIKNPLAIENTQTGHHRIRSMETEDLKKTAEIIASENGDGTKFVCRICLKSFTLQRLLNRHMKCHSEIKRYLCTFCGKGFNDTFDLKRHTRTHTGVRPYKCNLCEKSFTQRCSLESHCLKVHSVQHQYAYKERRTKMYVCEECGNTTCEPEVHYIHLKENHPYSTALLKFYDKRHFKFTNSQFANNLLGQLPMPVHN